MTDIGKAETPTPDPGDWQRLIRDVAAMITLAASGVTMALTGHDQVAGTVFGGLLMYLVPSSARVPRGMLALVGATAGSLLGGYAQG